MTKKLRAKFAPKKLRAQQLLLIYHLVCPFLNCLILSILIIENSHISKCNVNLFYLEKTVFFFVNYLL